MLKTRLWFTVAALALAAPVLAQNSAVPRPSGEARVPNLLGATGLLLIPSASVQRNRQFSASVAGSGQFFTGAVLAGVGNRGEVGATVLDADDDLAGGGTKTLANAKLNVVPETLMLPAVSVGVVDAFDALDRGSSWYMVTSKYLIPYFVRALTGKDLGLKLHLGYGGGLYDRELFGGVEIFLPRHLEAMLEVSSGSVNVGGRYDAGHFQATLGLFDLDHLGGGLCYTVPLR